MLSRGNTWKPFICNRGPIFSGCQYEQKSHTVQAFRNPQPTSSNCTKWPWCSFNNLFSVLLESSIFADKHGCVLWFRSSKFQPSLGKIACDKTFFFSFFFFFLSLDFDTIVSVMPVLHIVLACVCVSTLLDVGLTIAIRLSRVRSSCPAPFYCWNWSWTFFYSHFHSFLLKGQLSVTGITQLREALLYLLDGSI